MVANTERIAARAGKRAGVVADLLVLLGSSPGGHRNGDGDASQVGGEGYLRATMTVPTAAPATVPAARAAGLKP
jgi:hypothetical protein